MHQPNIYNNKFNTKMKKKLITDYICNNKYYDCLSFKS